MPRGPTARIPFLPAAGQISLPQLTASLGAAQRVLGLDDAARLRVASFVTPGGKQVPFVARLDVGSAATESCQEIVAGSIRLTDICGELEDVGTPERLRLFLNEWDPERQSPLELGRLEDSANLTRFDSHNPYARDKPCWRATLRITRDAAINASFPTGPFLSDSNDFFALSIGDAAARWLSQASLRDQPGCSDTIEVIVPDPRAFFASVKRQADTVVISIGGTETQDLHCVARAETFDGGDEQAILDVVPEGSEFLATLPLPKTAQRLNLYLMGKDGSCRDEYRENTFRHPGGQSVLNSRPQREVNALAELLQSVETGENEETEFKPFVDLSRRGKQDKAYEILQSTCAFANTHGGKIYIGVSKALEIEGVSQALFKTKGTASGTLDELRAKYAGAMQRLISEGISPTVESQMDWVQQSNLYVLRIDVKESSRKPHQVAEAGDIYVRRGGSSRKANPAELRELLKSNAEERRAEMDFFEQSGLQ